MDKAQVVEKFGVDPSIAGYNPRGYWIVESLGENEVRGNAELGYLCIRTADAGIYPIESLVFPVGNCVGWSLGDPNQSALYHYFRPLKQEK